MPTILSIQSAVAYGHVGNSAAVFPLQRLGFEVWPIDTLQYSNHPGHGAFRGRRFGVELIRDIVIGMDDLGVLGNCNAVLSGYLGEAAVGEAVLDAVRRVKTANPKALYCCDPVMGDAGPGLYVAAGIPEFFACGGVPAADIVTPNRFELEVLSGRSAATLEDALAAAAALNAMGPALVLVTSLERPDAAPDTAEMLLVERDAAWLVATPRLPLSVNGAGDALSALFLGHYLRSSSGSAALAAAASSLFAVLEATLRAGARELQLIAAQDEIVAPHRRFAPVRVQ